MVFKELLPSYFTKDTIFIGSKPSWSVEVLHQERNQIFIFSIFAHVRSSLASVYERHKEKLRLDTSEKLLFKIPASKLELGYMLIFAPRPSAASIKNL